MADKWLEEQNRKSAEFWRRVDAGGEGDPIATGVAKVERWRQQGLSDDAITYKLRGY